MSATPTRYHASRRRSGGRTPSTTSSYSAAPKRSASKRRSTSSPPRPRATSARRVSSMRPRPHPSAASRGTPPAGSRPPDPLHPLLAFLLLLEELALAGDVATVALGEDVLAHARGWSRGRSPGCRSAAWIGTSNICRGMSSLSLLDERPAAHVRLVAMGDQGERVDRLAVDEHVELHEVGGPVAGLARSRARRSPAVRLFSWS